MAAVCNLWTRQSPSIRKSCLNVCCAGAICAAWCDKDNKNLLRSLKKMRMDELVVILK